MAAVAADHVPGAQFWHAVAPETEEYAPKKQLKQVVESVAPTESEYVPRGQPVHLFALALDHVPAWHIVQLEAPIDENEPAAQLVHAAAPVVE